MGEQAVLKKNTFFITSSGKIEKCVSLSDNAISNPLARRKINVACFSKVPETTHFDAFFVSPDWVFWNDGFR